MHNSDYREGQTLYDDINDDFTKESSKKNNDSKYPAYKTIDFKGLKDINEDVVAWLYIPNSNVDYPVLQGSTNNTYLHTSIYKEYLYVGTLFLDARNNPDFTDDNSIIYGHNMNDGSMFGMMEEMYLGDEDFYKNNPYVQIYTPEYKMTLHVIGIELTDRYGDRYTTTFETRTAYIDWLNSIKENTQKKVEEPDPKKHTITLSTCYHHGIPTRLVLELQMVGCVSNNVYSQFTVDNGKIINHRKWEFHKDFSEDN
jgi:sortase B